MCTKWWCFLVQNAIQTSHFIFSELSSCGETSDLERRLSLIEIQKPSLILPKHFSYYIILHVNYLLCSDFTPLRRWTTKSAESESHGRPSSFQSCCKRLRLNERACVADPDWTFAPHLRILATQTQSLHRFSFLLSVSKQFLTSFGVDQRYLCVMMNCGSEALLCC